MAQNLEEFLNDPTKNGDTIKRVNRWDIERNGEVVIFKLFASDGEGYIVRFLCDNYPFSPPGVVFININGEMMDRSAWPHGIGLFTEYVKPPDNCFICADLTREGVQHHADWKGIWKSETHTLMDVFNFLHSLLNDPHYCYLGRLT